METATMGKVLVTARIENLSDLYNVRQGLLTDDKVRRIDVTDAMVDTGAMMLCMPKALIERLGLQRHRTRRMRTPSGNVETGVYEVVRLTVEGRDCAVEVLEVQDDCPVFIGQIPLEALDFMVDMVNRKLVGNPEHHGEFMVDVF